MKKTCLLLLYIFVIFITCTSCKHPPIGSKIVTDKEEYLETNSFVSGYLNNRYCGVLPSKEIASNESFSYRYEYSCELFGTPRFLIYNKLDQADRTLFSNEAERIQRLSSSDLKLDGNKTLYCFQPNLNTGDGDNYDLEYIKQYSDDETLDGQSFLFEMAIVDYDDNCIEYLYAEQWDFHEKSDTILKFLDPILQITQPANKKSIPKMKKN